MWYRWSDARIVPVKQLKDCGGKSRESCYPHSFGIRNNIKRETSSIHRGRNNGGNKTAHELWPVCSDAGRSEICSISSESLEALKSSTKQQKVSKTKEI